MARPGDEQEPTGAFARLKQMGRRLAGTDAEKDAPPATMERRSSKRVPLSLGVRIKASDGLSRTAKVRDVNLQGLSLEPVENARIGERITVGFDGYPDVCPAFALAGHVRRILMDPVTNAPRAMGLQIDRDSTSADALKNYRRLVLHYLHHRPLLDDLNSGYFEARCTSCNWIGRVGRRNPRCSRCSSRVVPV